MMFFMEMLEYGLFFGALYLFYVLMRKLWKGTDVKDKIEAIKETEVQYETISKFTEDHNLNDLKEKRETIDTFKRE